jgi:hypothetical protein
MASCNGCMTPAGTSGVRVANSSSCDSAPAAPRAPALRQVGRACVRAGIDLSIDQLASQSLCSLSTPPTKGRRQKEALSFSFARSSSVSTGGIGKSALEHTLDLQSVDTRTYFGEVGPSGPLS